MDELSQLLVEARGGSQPAFAAFVSKSQAEVWRFCAHLIGPVDADDATQETYLALWRGLPSFRGEASARTWLLVIARRTALRLGRRRKGLTELDRKASAPPPPADPQRWAEIGGMVDRLDENRRLAIVLTQVLGLSYAEAAEVCDCPVGTIRSRVARAREDLLAAWAEEDRSGDRWRRTAADGDRGASEDAETGGRVRLAGATGE